jgi:hypothetical protein
MPCSPRQSAGTRAGSENRYYIEQVLNVFRTRGLLGREVSVDEFVQALIAGLEVIEGKMEGATLLTFLAQLRQPFVVGFIDCLVPEGLTRTIAHELMAEALEGK